MMADLVLEAGVGVGFAALAGMAAWIFSRRVIARHGSGWWVGALILAIAAGIGFATLWGADRAFILLDPPQVAALPDASGSAAVDLSLFMVFLVGQAGAGLKHLGATVAAAGGAVLTWLMVTGVVVLRRWRADATTRRYLEGK